MNPKNSLRCFLFGHCWYMLRVRASKKEIKDKLNPNLITRNIYIHWRCKKCGLTHCNRRFKRYT